MEDHAHQLDKILVSQMTVLEMGNNTHCLVIT